MTEPLQIDTEIDDLPGAPRLRQGLADLQAGKRTAEALLLAIWTTRLRGLGIPVPLSAKEIEDPNLALYAALGERYDGPADDPYYQYNAWCREMNSFILALEGRIWREKRRRRVEDRGGD